MEPEKVRDNPRSAGMADPRGEGAPAGRAILLVEDHIQDELLTLRALRKCGIRLPVEVVRDGEEALDYLFARGRHRQREESDLPALVLMDLKLPKLDGQEVLLELRAHPRTRALPVVVLSTSSENRDVASSLRSGADRYMRKPVSFDEFLELVRELGEHYGLTEDSPP